MNQEFFKSYKSAFLKRFFKRFCFATSKRQALVILIIYLFNVRNSKDYDGDIKKKRKFLEENTPVFWVKEWKKFKISMMKAGKNKKLPRSIRL